MPCQEVKNTSRANSFYFIAEQLPFPKESFDAVFLYDALQHIQNRERALNECIRVVRPTEVVCVIEINDYGIEYFRRTEGFEVEKVDPTDFALADNITIKVVKGTFSNAYSLRRI